MSTTPRTDAAKNQYLTGKIGVFEVLNEARKLETELACLRADLERFTGHGLLDCHAICDQRDAAVAERDRLNDEVERLKKDNLDMGHWIGSKMYEPEWDSFKKSLEIIDHWKARVKKTEAALDVMTTELGKMFLSAAERADRNVELRRRAEIAEAELAKRDAEYLRGAKMVAESASVWQSRAEMAEASAKLWEADALRYANNTEFWKARAEKAEAALAAAVDGVIDGGNCREKMLYIHAPGDARGYMLGQPVKVILPAVDAAMKEASK